MRAGLVCLAFVGGCATASPVTDASSAAGGEVVVQSGTPSVDAADTCDCDGEWTLEDPPEPPDPATRTDRSVVSSEPELQAAETLYGQLVSMLSDNGDAPEAAGLLRRVVDACDAVLSPAASDELRIAALTLSADAHDRIATRRVTAPVTVPPAGMYSASQGYTPEAYRAVFTQHRRRSLAWMYCDAAARYEQALAIDPSDPRATAQLHAYGANFVAYCEAMRRRSEPLRDQRGR